MRLLFGISLALGLLATGPVSAQVVSYGPTTLLPQGNNPNYWAGGPTPVFGAGYADDPSQGNPVDGGMMNQTGGAGNCCDGNCGTCCDRWFGSLAGLYMGRSEANTFWTSYESANNANQVMNTNDARAEWGGGGEVKLGRWFNCGILASSCCDARNGVEVVYFFVGPMNGFSSIRGDSLPGGLVSTTIDLQDPGTASGNVEIGGNDSANYFDDATEHRIWRKDEVQNVELNFIRERTSGGDPLQVTWLAGVRFFRFNEGVIFGSVGGGAEFGDNGGANEAYLNIHCSNDLIGPQIGVRADYQWLSRVGLYIGTELGIFADQVSTRAHLYSGNGLEGYDIHGNSTDFSFLAQIDVGANYQVADHWRAFAGYRIVAVSGLALSDHQFPHYLAAVDELAVPQTNGDLILHGGIAGVEFTY